MGRKEACQGSTAGHRASMQQAHPGLSFPRIGQAFGMETCHSLLPTGPGTCGKGQLTETPVGTCEERAADYQEKLNIQVVGACLGFCFLRPALQNTMHESASPGRAHTPHSVHASFTARVFVPFVPEPLDSISPV